MLKLQDRGVDAYAGIDSMGKLVEMMIKPEFVQSVTALIDVATPKALQTTELIADAMVKASESVPQSIGLFGMARTMRKPGSKLVLGFASDLLQNLGDNFSKRVAGIKQLDDGER
jgi:hypothetical protein